MNPKHIPAVLIVVGLAAAGAAWWFWLAAPVTGTAPVAQLPPSRDEVLPPLELPPPDDLPAKPTPAPVAPIVVEALAPSPAIDPQGDLSTAIPDFIRLAESGDMITLMKTYAPPDELDKQSPEELAAMALMMQAMAQDPRMQQEMQGMVAEMKSIQYAVPTYDVTGNRATYTLPAGSREKNIVFIKVNGRWYRE